MPQSVAFGIAKGWPVANGQSVPFNSVAPAITGTAQEGQTLTCSTGTWLFNPTSYSYSWLYGDGSKIPSSNGSIYVCKARDIGKTIFCRVRATGASGVATTNSNETAPVAADPGDLFAGLDVSTLITVDLNLFDPTLAMPSWDAVNGVPSQSASSAFPTDRDVLIIGHRTQEWTGTNCHGGGRNVKIYGGQWLNTLIYGGFVGDFTDQGIRIRKVFAPLGIENGDGFARFPLASTFATSRYKNIDCRVENVDGFYDGSHGDAFQLPSQYNSGSTSSTFAEVLILNFTATTAYQALLMSNQHFDDVGNGYRYSIRRYHLKNANFGITREFIAGTGGLSSTVFPRAIFMIDMANDKRGDRPYDRIFEDVYIEPFAGHTLNDHIAPSQTSDTGTNPYTGASMVPTLVGGIMTYPAAMRLTGVVHEGAPPGGDFARLSPDEMGGLGIPGRGYISPGYSSLYYDESAACDYAISPTTLSQAEGNVGTTDFTFTVTRTGATTYPSSVWYTIRGTGTHPVNETDVATKYLDNALRFEAGESVKTITVPISADLGVEDDETFTVTIERPVPINGTISVAAAVGTVTNDDAAPTYDPVTDMPGCIAYIDANNSGSRTTTGSSPSKSVTQILDLKNGLAFVQDGSTAVPLLSEVGQGGGINGYDALNFATSNQALTCVNSIFSTNFAGVNKPFTMFAIFRAASVASVRTWLSLGAGASQNDGLRILLSTAVITGARRDNGTAVAVTNGSASTGIVYAIILTFDGTTGHLRVNGVDASGTISQAGSHTIANMCLGAAHLDGSPAQQFANGLLAKAGISNQALTGTNLTNLENWLRYVAGS